jgi:hypothetical protein
LLLDFFVSRKIDTFTTMKKITLLLVVALCACTDGPKKFPHEAVLQRPADFPTTTCDGTPIDWTWDKQHAYEEDRLLVHRSKEGCVDMVVIEHIQ